MRRLAAATLAVSLAVAQPSHAATASAEGRYGGKKRGT